MACKYCNSNTCPDIKKLCSGRGDVEGLAEQADSMCSVVYEGKAPPCNTYIKLRKEEREARV